MNLRVIRKMTGNRKKRLGVYAGSFDPLTVGHLWMIEQGVALFDQLVVAVGINPEKRYTFSLEDRLVMLRESLRPQLDGGDADLIGFAFFISHPSAGSSTGGLFVAVGK